MRAFCARGHLLRGTAGDRVSHSFCDAYKALAALTPLAWGIVALLAAAAGLTASWAAR